MWVLKILEIMKKVLSLLSIGILFISMNVNASTAKNSQPLVKQSCFSFYHGIFHEYYGGINIDNVGDFNYLVAQCQALFE